MLDPYQMAFVNIILVFSVLAGTVIFRFIYPKKEINLFYLLIILSLLPLLSILRKGTYESGDLSSHAKIAMSFFVNLKDGNLIPRWGAEFCGGYGCPDFLFFYLLPYYIIGFFHIVGLSFIGSIKLFLIVVYIFSGIAMYFWAKEELGSKIAGFVAGLFYLFAPYHLVNMHFRVDIAELLTFVFLPLNFLFSKKLIEKSETRWFVLQVLALSLLIISHQAISLAFFPFILAYGLFVWYRKKGREPKELFLYFLSILTTLLLLSFYWMPILLEKQYIFWGNKATITFPNFADFFYSSWRYGFLFQGPKGELSFVIGYVQWFLILLSVFLLFRKKVKQKNLLLFCLISFFSIFLLMQSFSKSLWDIVPLIKSFQFSYRLLALTSFFTSIIAAIIASQINKKWFYIAICFFAIFQTILNWGNRRVIPEIDDIYLRREFMYLDSLNIDLNTPKWVNTNESWTLVRKNKNIEVINGNAQIKEVYRNTTRHEYVINVKTKSTIRENTFYFPGWNLYVNNRLYKINYEQGDRKGTITFNLNPGLYNAELLFEETPVRKMSKMITFGTFGTVLLIIFYILFFKSRKIKRTGKKTKAV
ncbi:MAG: 6-pyruvoyl-tetrahydropterin synthase-related protein [Candidatus Levybacteria bacterium]|nr:6-pyruvoyl-tetrahydropterin synthase-related protein [Candidatus Levybacteria bacterium]